MGAGDKKTPCIKVRLVEIRSGKTCHSALTSVLDPLMLHPYVVADLDGRRWRIEEGFNTIKRLLGLSYIWTGSLNGIKLQLWGTWLFYAVLIDLGDAVADELSVPCHEWGASTMETHQAPAPKNFSFFNKSALPF
jgi:IS4 transposase